MQNIISNNGAMKYVLPARSHARRTVAWGGRGSSWNENFLFYLSKARMVINQCYHLMCSTDIYVARAAPTRCNGELSSRIFRSAKMLENELSSLLYHFDWNIYAVVLLLVHFFLSFVGSFRFAKHKKGLLLNVDLFALAYLVCLHPSVRLSTFP